MKRMRSGGIVGVGRVKLHIGARVCKHGWDPRTELAIFNVRRQTMRAISLAMRELFFRCALMLALALPTSAAAQVTIGIDDVAGEAGDQVDFNVSLSAEGPAVVAIQNEVHVPDGVAVASCKANEAIGKDATLFGYLPPDCQPGLDCSGVRALVFSLADIQPIPNGSVLYSCTVSIDAAVPSETTLPIACADPGASTAAGTSLDTECRDGRIAVVEPVLPPCIGDCDGDHRVLVSELLAGVNLLLGHALIESCPAFDRDLDELVTVDEIVAGIGQALRGCPE